MIVIETRDKDGRKIDDRDRVIYTGSSSEQRTFGRYTGDWNLLQVGKEYTVVDKKCMIGIRK